jgi:16S rRNA (cytidine1402-2'-O)-methyltransferase
VTNTSSQSAGTLYIVATPIGNLEDLSSRAARMLGQVALVAAEDTRHSRRLLDHLSLRKDMLSLHEHNEENQIARILAILEGGDDVAVVADAGTPLISDPGLKLTQAAIAAGVEVVGIPGPSAVIAALSVAGLATDRFVFEGFLPRRLEARRARLLELAGEPRTLVFFESVHRIAVTLDDMIAAFGGAREAVLARELTKLNEQLARGPLAELAPELGSGIPLKGEFVIVVAGSDRERTADDAEILRIYALLAGEVTPARAVALTARITGRSRNEVYALARA